MHEFYALTVTDVHHDTRDAVVLTLQPDAEHKHHFNFKQGQYLTFKQHFDGQELRRSYSICAGLDDGHLRVGIKRVADGCFSSWAKTRINVGDKLEAMPPMGNFHSPIDAASERYYLGFAGGSGITPVLGIIKTLLLREPHSRFTLVYANQSISSIMFREELEDIKNEYLGRFNLIHVLEHDVQDIELFCGRIDQKKCEALFAQWIDIKSVSTAFICGPEPMMLTIAASLKQHGLADDHIKYELFNAAQPGRVALPAKQTDSNEADQCDLSLTLDGATRSLSMPRQGQTVLQAALAANLDAPYACTAGVCSTCKARLIEGEVDMNVNHALEDYEVRQGFILTCQSVPITDRIVVDYDQ